jgi:hypothetical protein
VPPLSAYTVNGDTTIAKAAAMSTALEIFASVLTFMFLPTAAPDLDDRRMTSGI